jgi:hypothetical protein
MAMNRDSEEDWRKLLQIWMSKEVRTGSQSFLDGIFVAAKRGGEQIGITKIGRIESDGDC